MKQFEYNIRTIGIPENDGEFIILNQNIKRIINGDHFDNNEQILWLFKFNFR